MFHILRAALAAAFVVQGGPASAEAAGFALPPANAGYDSQLGGAYPPAAGVTVVSRDREEAPAAGLYSICYVNAFQTQAHEAGWWKQNHDRLLLRTASGAYAEDDNWPGEILLDTSSEEKRAAILAIVGPWIDRCAADGFQAVEPDNLDSWTRSDGRLTASDNLLMARMIADRAHRNGLAAAQKNAGELGELGRLLGGLDFAVVESCRQFGECDGYMAVYGDRVFAIEYPAADARSLRRGLRGARRPHLDRAARPRPHHAGRSGLSLRQLLKRAAPGILPRPGVAPVPARAASVAPSAGPVRRLSCPAKPPAPD